ncbi:MAG: hypothetical protein QE164_07815 [Candidatus Nezhaarchaeota archaeon]|nr:hypothetical protein [Candidatus Nezhaarchaeota archaeon]
MFYVGLRALICGKGCSRFLPSRRREVMRIFGTFLETGLESKCLKELSTCIEELVKTLKSVSL